MDYYFLDASALAKRYVPETGTPSVKDLIDRVPDRFFIILILAFGEIMSIFVRKRNNKIISETAYYQVIVEFEKEFLNNPEILIQSVTDELVKKSLSLIELYSINASDAIILESALRIANELREIGDNLILITADIRLYDAAKSSGIKVWNPETDGQLATSDYDILRDNLPSMDLL